MKSNFLHQITTKVGIALTVAALAVTPFVANAASLTASGSGTTKTVGQSFNVSVVADGAGANISAFQGNVSVSNLSVTSVSMGGTYLCTVNPSVSNLNFACTVQGAAVPSATVYTMTVQGIAAGPASVSISGVRVLNAAFADTGAVGSTASYTMSAATSTNPTPPAAPAAPKASSAPKATTSPKVTAATTQNTDTAAVTPVTPIQQPANRVASNTGAVKGASSTATQSNSSFLGSTFLGIYDWIWLVALLWVGIGSVLYYRRRHAVIS